MLDLPKIQQIEIQNFQWLLRAEARWKLNKKILDLGTKIKLIRLHQNSQIVALGILDRQKHLFLWLLPLYFWLEKQSPEQSI